MHSKINYLFVRVITILFAVIDTSCKNTTDTNTIILKDIVTINDVAPIIYKNCTPCHRSGESGPFTLMSYSDIIKNARKIKFVTQTRYMPPWPADVNYTHFIGERTLSDTQIATIAKWVNNGMLIGDTNKKINPPTYYTGSFFKKPDTTIWFKNAIPIKGNGSDHFYIVKVPITLPKDTFVNYFEFVPHHRKLTHHVNGHLINYDVVRKKNSFNGMSYSLDEYTDYKNAYKNLNILNDDESFPTLTPNTVYYLPGYTPPVYPEGIGGYKINKTSAILLKSIHYGPSNKDVLDSSCINIFYGKKPIRPIYETQLGTFGISKIEPELILYPNKIQTFHTQAKLDNTISVLSINPHMHLLGKSFWAFAVTPNNDTIPLIKIKKWDFRWQYYYTFKQPVKISSGTTIHVYGTFDNTDKNPFNPNHPPKLVLQGEGVKSMKTTEEMFQCIFTYLPYMLNDEDLKLEK